MLLAHQMHCPFPHFQWSRHPRCSCFLSHGMPRTLSISNGQDIPDVHVSYLMACHIHCSFPVVETSHMLTFPTVMARHMHCSSPVVETSHMLTFPTVMACHMHCSFPVVRHPRCSHFLLSWHATCTVHFQWSDTPDVHISYSHGMPHTLFISSGQDTPDVHISYSHGMPRTLFISSG